MESYLHQENQRENYFSAGLRVEVPAGFSGNFIFSRSAFTSPQWPCLTDWKTNVKFLPLWLVLCFPPVLWIQIWFVTGPYSISCVHYISHFIILPGCLAWNLTLVSLNTTILPFAVWHVLSLVLGWLRPELISNAMQGKTNIGFIFQHRQSKIISKSQNSRLVNSGRMLLAAGIDSAQKANPVSTRSHRVQKCEILRLQRSGRRFSEKYLCLEDPGGISGPIAHSDWLTSPSSTENGSTPILLNGWEGSAVNYLRL